MSDEAIKEQEMREKETAEREAQEREEAERAEKALAEQTAETVTPTENENTASQSTGHIESAVELQAARYAYIENLERRIMADDFVEQGELEDAMNCKAQVLLELVAVEDYASKLGKDNPSLPAIGVLKDHLYKCYNKTEKMRDRLAQERQKQLLGKQHEEYDYQQRHNTINLEYPELLRNKQYNFGVFQDKNNNMINLTGLGLSAGSVGMLSQLIKNPSESIKAQMPDLITEFASKVSGQDKEAINGFIGSLTAGLNTFKSVKAMTDALEGVGQMAKMLSALKGGNAI